MRYYLIVPKTTFDEKLNPEHPNFDEALPDRLGMFRYHTFFSGFNANRTNILQPPTKCLVEVEYDQTLPDGSIDESRLQQLVTDSIILDFGHWPHLNDGKQACIFCKMQQNNEWTE